MEAPIYISKFNLPCNGFSFLGAYLFQVGDNCLLIQREKGTTMLISKELSFELINNIPSEDLQFKLVQRGFGAIGDSYMALDANDSTVPNFFLIDLTNSCNLRCKYCFRQLRKEEAIITIEELEPILRYICEYIKSNNIQSFSIQAWGGEPLLAYERIIYIQDYFAKEGMSPELSIETNGTLITREKAEVLYKRNIGIGVSIDGNALVHNMQRPLINGQGSFKQVLEGIENLSSAGYSNLGSISVVTKNSISYLETILDFFAKDLKLSHIKLNPLRKTSSCDELGLAEEELEEYVERVLQRLIKLHKEGYYIIEDNIAGKLTNLLVRPDENICNAKGCTAGRGLITINKNGDIFPCEMSDYEKEAIGSIFDNNTLSSMVIEARKSHNFYKVKQSQECKTCPWWYYCRGGCSSSVRFTDEKISSIDKTECTINRVLYPKLVELLLTEPRTVESLIEGFLKLGWGEES